MKVISRSNKGDERKIKLAFRYPPKAGVLQVRIYSESQGISPFPILTLLPSVVYHPLWDCEPADSYITLSVNGQSVIASLFPRI